MTRGTFSISRAIYSIVRDIGMVAVVGWLIKRLITETQRDSITAANRMAIETTREVAKVMSTAAGDMADVVARHVGEAVGSAVNDAIRNQSAALVATELIPHPDDMPTAMVDDPTQGEGPIPWYQQGLYANDGGPMTRPIDPTDMDWPDPSSTDPAHRTTMIRPGEGVGLIDQIAAMPFVPDEVAFGPSGFPTMGSDWSAIPRPNLAGEEEPG